MNAETSHGVDVGSLVELHSTGDEDLDGIQMYVVHHSRDCDQTPLYCLSHDKFDTEVVNEGFRNAGWISGISEDCLRIVVE